MSGPPSRAGSEHGSLGNSQVGAASNGTSGGAAAGSTSHRPANRNRRCDAFSHGGGGRRGIWSPLYKARETKVFSPLEHERIRLACGLDPANYDAGRPPIYAVFLAEGRLMVKVKAVLQKFLAPAPNDWDPLASTRRRNSCAT
jgi:hypothetical protein